MALMRCKDCKAKISTKATQCPKCGAPVAPKEKKKSGCGLAVVMLIVAIGAIVAVTKDGSEGTATTTTNQTPGSGRNETASNKSEPRSIPASIAGDVQAVGETINISRSESETFPAIRLYEMIQNNPDARVLGVVGSYPLNENVVDHIKVFYDSELNVLAVMVRSVFDPKFTTPDTYSWTVFQEVSPDIFKDGIPYTNDNISVRVSATATGNARDNFPFRYESNPRITEWP